MFYILKIPYISKGSLKSTASKETYSFQGNAYIYVEKNSGKMFHSFALLNDNFKYRATDPKMMQTHYWRNKNFQETRKLFFENRDKSYQIITFSGKIEKLNQHIMQNFNTILTTQGLIYGSNPAGAEQNINSSILLINEERYQKKYKYHRFVNFFNSLEDKTIKFSNEELIKMYNETDDFLSIEDYFTNFPYLKEEFESKYNYEFTDKFSDKDFGNITGKFENYKVQSIIQLYEENFYTLEEFKVKMRGIFSANVSAFLKEKTFKKTYTKGENHPSPKKAHILSFSSLINNGRYFEAVDPKNCIMISPNLHDLFDNNFITYDPNGKCIRIKGNINVTDEYNISSTIIKNFGIKKYLRENYDHYIIKGVNY
ncbi:MAG4270 family putative restriction endonuclease [Spiroplasma culicicola]|uniref:Uncharacterized protein n=1 Tax=Spiroplasma culicicola AES-1 TaxID=1276246 RepID=W6AH79_9MOLU|nr:HNH endonuclease [Spiroplasma culicicola]AHI53044.1 hypothetical protein SCULI_v1c07030 [Spiroplasma culicicola AES-1]